MILIATFVAIATVFAVERGKYAYRTLLLYRFVAASKKRRILPASLPAGFTFKNRT